MIEGAALYVLVKYPIGDHNSHFCEFDIDKFLLISHAKGTMNHRLCILQEKEVFFIKIPKNWQNWITIRVY